jgi:isocitrate/isopropylmalate dehydrogenase
MKIRFLLTLLGLAISFALPAFAQQKDTADPQIAEQLKELSKRTNEAFNNNDAAAVAALYYAKACSSKNQSYYREGLRRELRLFRTKIAPRSKTAARRIRLGIDQTLNKDKVRTADLGGTASTEELTRALISRVN